jgi:hypothetical protein
LEEWKMLLDVKKTKTGDKSLKIHEYLLNPHKVGIFNCNFEIQTDDIIRLLEEAVNFDKKDQREPETYNTLRFRRHEMDEGHPWLFNDLKEVLDHLDIYKPDEPPLGPWQLKKPFNEVLTEEELRHEMILQESHRSMFTAYPSPRIFFGRYQAVVGIRNAISLDFDIKSKVLRLNLYCLNEQGIDAYKEFLESIPIIGKNIKISKVIQKFSSRYCYKIYPSALIVWLCEVIDNPIPNDILQYFLGAVNYYAQREVRISIVLSAIAVETIMAELYEEIKHQPAPPGTLGQLFAQVKKLTQIPDEIKSDVDEVNNNRILSVHRSSAHLGDQEARFSLMGATRFAHWVYFEGPFSR